MKGVIRNCCKEAGTFFSTMRKRTGQTRRDLSMAGGVDPSYLTLIERVGYIPTRSKALLVAKALRNFGVPIADTEHWLILCGYAPPSLVTAGRRVHAVVTEASNALCSADRVAVMLAEIMAAGEPGPQALRVGGAL